MSEPDWKTRLAADIEVAIGISVDCGGTLGVCRVRDVVVRNVLPHIEAAYQRGLQAGRSQDGYTTRRKKKEDPCTAGAAGPTPASITDEPPEGSAP